MGSLQKVVVRKLVQGCLLPLIVPRLVPSSQVEALVPSASVGESPVVVVVSKLVLVIVAMMSSMGNGRDSNLTVLVVAVDAMVPWQWRRSLVFVVVATLGPSPGANRANDLDASSRQPRRTLLRQGEYPK